MNPNFQEAQINALEEIGQNLEPAFIATANELAKCFEISTVEYLRSLADRLQRQENEDFDRAFAILPRKEP